MRLRPIAANLAAAIVTALPAHSARAMQAERSTGPSERRIPVGNASLDDFFASVRPDADRH
jgi:hypothetical protein